MYPNANKTRVNSVQCYFLYPRQLLEIGLSKSSDFSLQVMRWPRPDGVDGQVVDGQIDAVAIAKEA